MRKTLIVAVVICVFCALAAYAFDPSELNKVTFKNNTGEQIQMIFLSPGDSQEWGPDIVGSDYHISNGNSVTYYVHYPNSSFKFDIMATDKKNNTYEIYNYTLKDSTQPTIVFNKSNRTSTVPDFHYVNVTVTNDLDNEIYYLFVSPSDSDAWGADMLDTETTLSAGDTYSFDIPVSSKVTYNLMAVDENNDEYTFDITLDTNKTKVKVSVEPSDLNSGN